MNSTSECCDFSIDFLTLIQSICLIFVAIFSSSACLLLISVVFRSTLFHINVRILLINSFAAAWFNILAQSIVAGYNIIFYFNACNSPISRLECFWLTWFLVPSTRLFMEFLGALTFEHYLISFRPEIFCKTLSSSSKKTAKYLAAILIVSLYVLNGCFIVKSYFGVSKVADQRLDYCNSFFTVDGWTQSLEISNKLMHLLKYIDLLVEVVGEDWEEDDQDDRTSTRKCPFQMSSSN
uniref:Uncharacterized protein n=1 Tax=Romanomermis culicivorax TaxID=13658 RepID=A0A915J7P8_ROMCU